MNSAASGSACDLRKRGVVQDLAGRVHLLHTPILQHEPARNGPQVNGGAKRVLGMLTVSWVRFETFENVLGVSGLFNMLWKECRGSVYSVVLYPRR